MGPVEQQLREARERIRNPKNWTKGEFARDSQGQRIRAHASDAHSFCAVGALLCDYDIHHLDAETTLARAIHGDPHGAVAKWNDAPERTHEQVIAAYGLAISLAKRQGA